MTLVNAAGIGIEGRLMPTDLGIGAGELVALVGPNGGGKTSLLRALARVEHATGTVSIAGEQLDMLGEARRRRLLSFLPASRDVGWPISARDVIALGLVAPDPSRVADLIERLELEQLADRPIDRLSTGERARVLLARAIAARPQVLLLDEPLSNLEPYWVLRLLELLRQSADDGAAVLVALHDLVLLPRFDRALLIAGGELQMDETPADLLASERFEELFRVRAADGGWQIKRQVDRRSLP